MPRSLLFVALLLALTACRRDREPEPRTPAEHQATLGRMGITPQLQVRPPPHQGGYRLPFDGEWFVISTHYGKAKADGPQAFAVDIGKPPVRSDKYPPDQHGCWGQPILADGPGLIAVAVDGVYDNQETGVPNRYDLHGNYVVIDHQNGEYSLFAHLQQGSVTVKAGQVVQMGQPLGLCGNSGRSFRPHVHWQVMSHPHTQYARGLPIRHIPYLVNGKPSSGRLEKGQRVRMP